MNLDKQLNLENLGISTFKKSNRKQVIFINAPARSGTTSFRRILNSHPDICIFGEKYNEGYIYTENDFENENIKKIFYQETKISNKFLNMSTYKKNQSLYFSKRSKIFGDKRPNMYLNEDKIFSNFNSINVINIYIIRNAIDIISSFKRRAEDNSDKWDNSKNHIFAIQKLNIFYKQLLERVIYKNSNSLYKYLSLIIKPKFNPRVRDVYVPYDLVYNDNYKALLDKLFLNLTGNLNNIDYVSITKEIRDSYDLKKTKVNDVDFVDNIFSLLDLKSIRKIENLLKIRIL